MTALELAVGAMLVVLGVDVFRRLVRRRIHVHVHTHADGIRHVHAHAHAHAPGAGLLRRPATHRHQHPARLPRRALAVGVMHGLALAIGASSVGLGLFIVYKIGVACGLLRGLGGAA